MAGLLGKLSGEKERWETQVRDLKTALSSLPYHAVLAAAFVTYLGGEAEELRRQTMHQWSMICAPAEADQQRNVIRSPTAALERKQFDLLKFLSSESQTLNWKGQGLPSDTLSLENALILQNATQTPFVIGTMSHYMFV